MRFVMKEKWCEVPFGSVNKLAIVAGTGATDAHAPARDGGGAGLVFSGVLADGANA